MQRHIKDIGGKNAHSSELGTLLEQKAACISRRNGSEMSLPEMLRRTHPVTVRPHSGSWACAVPVHLVDSNPRP